MDGSKIIAAQQPDEDESLPFPPLSMIFPTLPSGFAGLIRLTLGPRSVSCIEGMHMNIIRVFGLIFARQCD
jgi:hypothetical protein